MVQATWMLHGTHSENGRGERGARVFRYQLFRTTQRKRLSKSTGPASVACWCSCATPDLWPLRHVGVLAESSSSVPGKEI